MARFNPQPFNAANVLDADLARRNNALNAGLPANFLVVNPHLLGGAEIGNGGGTLMHLAAALELRKRLHNLQFGTNYSFGRAFVQNFFSHRRPFEYTEDAGGEGVTHAFKANWVYELPFGRGQRFGGGADRCSIGSSAVELTASPAFRPGALIDFGNARLVGMSLDEFRDAFNLRFDDAGRVVHAAAGHRR